jgi:hypothetical protein
VPETEKLRGRSLLYDRTNPGVNSTLRNVSNSATIFGYSEQSTWPYSRDGCKCPVPVDRRGYRTELVRSGGYTGSDNRHCFRAKFHGRYRLFYRFSTDRRIIIYAWVNDESSLRESALKTDPYAIFKAMPESGDPPNSFVELLRTSKAVDASGKSPPSRKERKSNDRREASGMPGDLDPSGTASDTILTCNAELF